MSRAHFSLGAVHNWPFVELTRPQLECELFTAKSSVALFERVSRLLVAAADFGSNLTLNKRDSASGALETTSDGVDWRKVNESAERPPLPWAAVADVGGSRNRMSARWRPKRRWLRAAESGTSFVIGPLCSGRNHCKVRLALRPHHSPGPISSGRSVLLARPGRNRVEWPARGR